MIKDTPNPKPRSPNLETYLAKRRQPPPISRIAHEIVNQLTVLNLIGSKILSRFPVGFEDTKLARETEIFERSIHEATLLVQQLADHMQSDEEFANREEQRGKPVAGQVIRLLRDVTGNNR